LVTRQLRPQVTYRAFYEALIDWGRGNPETLIGQQIERIDALLDRVLTGGGWDTVVPEAGSIIWPPEEVTFLAIVRDLPRFWRETDQFLASQGWSADLSVQATALVEPGDDFEAFAREVVWYGRKTGRTLKRQELSEAA
jgi:hypothetical protein